MANTLIIYPNADGTIGHSLSNGSVAYTLINEVNNSTTGYIEHTLETSSTTKTSSFTRFLPASNINIGKIILRSINSVNLYLGERVNGNSRIDNINISCIVNINNTEYNTANYTSILVSDQQNTTRYDNPTLSITNSSDINIIYSSLSLADINLTLTTIAQGTQTNTGYGKNFSANLYIYNANVTISYDNVYDCSAEIIAGVGISSVSPTTQEVIEGDSCTFSCTLLSSDWKFYGWYENSDFSGNPVSTSQTYTINSVTKNITLYPRAIPKYNIHIYGDSTKFSYTCSATDNKEFQNEQVTISITLSSNIYKFSGIYEADTSGNKTSNHISNDNPYTFTMPASDVYLYVEIGKEIRIYVDCNNCSLQGQTSPILSSVGKTETITLTYDSSSADWSGIYTDNKYVNRVSSTQTYTFVVGNNDIYLYAKAIPKQQIYVKENGSWVGYSAVYVKENGIWVKKDDYAGIFDTLKNYKRINI